MALTHGQFDILGCVEVAGPRGRLRLTSARQRALVAALALHPGAVVPNWRLVEALWGERPPRTAVRSLHSHVARLRPGLDACGMGGVVQTRFPGYLLSAEPSTVDAWRFEQDAQAGRASLAAGHPETAIEVLAKALSLWRGSALADAEPAGWTAAQASRLEELRQVAVEDWCEALLCLGRYGDALVELDRLVPADSTRERPVGLHMIALSGSGRGTEALDAFQRLRRRLADELGVDPSLELVDLHTAMLRAVAPADLRAPGSVAGPRATAVPATPARPRPAQLPAPVGYFTGRSGELDRLEGLIDNGGNAPPPVVLICGPGGIGKTSLAVEFAHRVAARFPDGQLFVDAHGHDSVAALAPGEVVAVLLRCLGVPDEQVPNELGVRIGLYRSLLAGKRMLIVLDNAGATAQVTPLIPNDRGSVLVVTSRKDLAALMTQAEVHPVVLDVLTTAEATDLLTRMLGMARVSREPEAVAHLAVLCGRMPLALRIAGAKLAMQPRHPVGAFVAELSGGDRLAQLGIEDGARSVEAVFSSAYRALQPAARRLFRLLGLHPGPHVSAHLAAALAGSTLEAQREALAELTGGHLITQPEPGRYRLHDLLQLYANHRAMVDEPSSARIEAMQRLLDWYLAAAHAATQILDPNLNRIAPVLRHPPPPVPFDATREAALSFLESERDNLLPVVRIAGEHGQPAAACQLVYLLSSLFVAHGHWSQRVDMCRHGVRAARLLGDAALEAEMHRTLGVAYRATHQLKLALDSHQQALLLLGPLGDERAMAYVYNNIGGASVDMRLFGAAIEAYHRSLTLHGRAGNEVGVAIAERNLGYVYIRMERPELSFPHLDRALAGARTLGYRRLEASALDSLGEAHLRQARHDQALRSFQAALTLSRGVGDRVQEMDALVNIGLTQLAAGAAAAAAASLGQALLVSRSIAHRPGEARILNHLGEAYLRLGDHGAAGRHLEVAAELRRTLPDAYEEASLRRNLGDLADLTGDPAAAAGHRRRAIGLYRDANANAEADRLAVRLAAASRRHP
jgi:DNA-binding SARP family transcriptional activator